MKQEEYSMLQWALRELFGAMPARRDWFNPDAEKVLREYLAAPAAPAVTVSPAPSPTDASHFKNFHRALCARFGYTHDDEYWWRDLVSLEEHIARQAQPTDRDAVRNAALEEVADWHDREGWLLDEEDVPAAIRALKGKSGSEGAAE